MLDFNHLWQKELVMWMIFIYLNIHASKIHLGDKAVGDGIEPILYIEHCLWSSLVYHFMMCLFQHHVAMEFTLEIPHFFPKVICTHLWQKKKRKETKVQLYYYMLHQGKNCCYTLYARSQEWGSHKSLLDVHMSIIDYWHQ